MRNDSGFAIFDIETRIDKTLLNRVFCAGQGLTDHEAYARFRQDLRGRNSDFMPVTLHVPIAIAIGDVGEDYVLRSVESLTEQNYSEERLVREFWRREERFGGIMVSFNGRGFDLPVLELAALRYGIAAPQYFYDGKPAGPRYSERHFDLYDFLSNDGARGLRGGFNLLLKMIGLPGKTGIDGSQVQELFEMGRLDEIQRYCRADVIQTYFLFLRIELMRGRIDGERYRAAWDGSAPFLDGLDASPESSQN